MPDEHRDRRPETTPSETQAPTLSELRAPPAPNTEQPRSPSPELAALDLQTVDPSLYRVHGEHARGGLGRVMAAHDRRLDRPVAIKELLRASHTHEARFIREALITARLQHPSIVRVYEAGRWPGGEPFYAMQMVSGRSLRERIEEARTLSERLALLPNVLAVADAIAYAHNEGIIHRDLKPANILVGPFGETLVIDWGLAKDLADHTEEQDLGSYRVVASELTLAGAVVGTPEYMPLEQAQGGPVDARADVYALGAILYHVLTGDAPYSGANSLEVLELVRAAPPQPLERRQADVPAELTAIVTKAMSRRAGDRYVNAKELADDLRRFQTGQLVGAHRYSARELLLRGMKRHRALTVAVVALAGLVATAVISQRLARQQARLAQEFGQRVENLEARLRYANLLPAHDTRAERSAFRGELRRFEAEVASLGRVAEGPGLYAAGRAHLALGEYEVARPALQRAWEAGYRAPALASALGRTLGELYRLEIERARGVSAREREALQKEAQRRYRDPALEYLRSSRGATEHESLLVQSLITLYEGQIDQAVSRAREAAARAPWFYEARQLEGRIHLAAAEERMDRGDHAGALARFSRAQEAFAGATAIARSDVALAADECRRATVQFVEKLELVSGHDPIEGARIACQPLLRLDPDHVGAHLNLARQLWELAEHQREAGQDPEPRLDEAASLVSHASELEPKNGDVHESLASIETIRSKHLNNAGRDPRPAVARCAQASEKAMSIRPTASGYVLLGSCLMNESDYASNHGIDPTPTDDRVIAAYRRALEILPDWSVAHANLGRIYFGRAIDLMVRGQDVREPVRLSLESLQAALRSHPNDLAARTTLPGVRYVAAAYECGSGRDPHPIVEVGVAEARKAVDAYPDALSVQYYWSQLEYYDALCQLRRGQDPSASLAAVREHATRASRLIPVYGPMGVAQAEMVAARWALRQGRSPLHHLQAAENLLTRALAADPNCVFCQIYRAEAARWRAEWGLTSGQRPLAEIRRGLELADDAARRDPRLGDALALRAALLRLEAKLLPAAQRAGRLEAARTAHARALALGPLLAGEFGTPDAPR